MIEIIPAIDLIGGRCVRLSQGDYGRRTEYDGLPADVAAGFADCGVKRLHVVDLDGAKVSKPCNLKVLESIAVRTGIEIEWGGGLSTQESIGSAFDAGATHCIVGSAAVLHPGMFRQWLALFGGWKMILGADVRGRKVAVKGWQEDSDSDIEGLVESFLKDGLEETICTDISRDGMLQGPNIELYQWLQGRFPGVSFTVSGGISSMEDVERLSEAGLRKVIVGKAIYENRITLKQIEQWSQNA